MGRLKYGYKKTWSNFLLFCLYLFLCFRRVTIRVFEKAKQPCCQRAHHYWKSKQLLPVLSRQNKCLKGINHDFSYRSIRFLHGFCGGQNASSFLRNHQRLNFHFVQQHQQRRHIMLLRILRAATKVRYIFMGAAGTAGVGAKLVS